MRIYIVQSQLIGGPAVGELGTCSDEQRTCSETSTAARTAPLPGPFLMTNTHPLVMDKTAPCVVALCQLCHSTGVSADC